MTVPVYLHWPLWSAPAMIFILAGPGFAAPTSPVIHQSATTRIRIPGGADCPARPSRPRAVRALRPRTAARGFKFNGTKMERNKTAAGRIPIWSDWMMSNTGILHVVAIVTPAMEIRQGSSSIDVSRKQLFPNNLMKYEWSRLNEQDIDRDKSTALECERPARGAVRSGAARAKRHLHGEHYRPDLP
ncbi:unnamed protein product [Chrysodeixis includens]|uniref:Uncharacterized protein n=1 Tax=Chrysodeixis includens TaxID=689277 RepID=A0A9N8KUY6_CHRIL|nr:unnamed protein product [Chrysodeixis includens]